MEITASEMYWLLMLDNIKSFCGWGVALSIITPLVVICLTAIASSEYNLSDKAAGRILFVTLPSSVIALILFVVANTFVPTTKQMAMIKVIPAIASSNLAKDLSSDAKEVYKLGIEAIKEQLKVGEK